MFILRGNCVLRVEHNRETLYYQHDKSLSFIYRFSNFLVTGDANSLVTLSPLNPQDFKRYLNVHYKYIIQGYNSVFLISEKTSDKIAEKRMLTLKEENIINRFKSNYNQSDTSFFHEFLREDFVMNTQKQLARDELLKKKADVEAKTDLYIYEFNGYGYRDSKKLKYPKYTQFRARFNEDYNPELPPDHLDFQSVIPSYCIREDIDGVFAFSTSHYIVYVKNKAYEFNRGMFSEILTLSAGSKILYIKGRSETIDTLLIFYIEDYTIKKCDLHQGRTSHLALDNLIEDNRFFTTDGDDVPYPSFISPYNKLWRKQEELEEEEMKQLHFTKNYYLYVESFEVFQLSCGVGCVITYTCRVLKSNPRIMKFFVLKNDNDNVFKVMKINLMKGEHILDLTMKRDIITLQTTTNQIDIDWKDVNRFYGQSHSIMNSIFPDNVAELQYCCFDFSNRIDFTNQILLYENICKIDYTENLYEMFRQFLINGEEFFCEYVQKGVPLEDFQITHEKLDALYLNDNMEVEHQHDEIEINEEEREYHHIVKLTNIFLPLFYIRRKETSNYYLVIPLSNSYSTFILEVNENFQFLYYPVKRELQNSIFDLFNDFLTEEDEAPSSTRFLFR